MHASCPCVIECDSASFGNPLLALFREASPSEALCKIHVNMLNDGVIIQGLPEPRLFGVRLAQRKIQAEGSISAKEREQSWGPVRSCIFLCLAYSSCVLVGALLLSWETLLFSDHLPFPFLAVPGDYQS